MPERKVHILITGEAGATRTLVLRRRSIKTGVISVAVAALFGLAASSLSIHLFSNNRSLQDQVALLEQETETSTIQTALRKEAEELRHQLVLARAELAANKQEKSRLVNEYEAEITALMKDHESQIQGSISRLDERARIIESVMDKIGLKVSNDDDDKHSGGPFISADPKYGEKLIDETDRYLKVLENMPLGRPVSTSISSGYGERKDPLNGAGAFHFGIDFRGRTGDPIRATGNGRVKVSGYNASFGNHVILSHGNGYETMYAHLKKRLVKRGDKVTREQTIGLLGNTGRSTGSHLHYEIHHHGKPVDPMKFIQVAKLSNSEKQ